MANMSLKKNPMPAQAPDVRNKNFEEVTLGYTRETAMDEAIEARRMISGMGLPRRSPATK